MEKLCSGHVRANRLSALAQAADCLAKAAVTLSEAARAAAETFSSELLDITSTLNSVSETQDGWRENSDEDEDEECTNPEDTDYYVSDDGGVEERVESTPVQAPVDDTQNNIGDPCSAGPMTLDQLRFDPNRPPSVISVTSEVETTAGLAYRILVDNEADVLLFVCALIQNRRKVICYMNCSIPAFHMYKKFINDVTATAVYTITKITTAEITEIGQKFLEADRSVLLLPETTVPSIEVDEIDSWVIHVGWPSDEQRYEEQRLIHQAQNSIVVACSEDEELYPAGAAIMWQSQPWPRDDDSFRASVALLRPVFEQKLELLPPEMKAKVYPDWISCHGPRGHRYVKSWDAITLVKRANSFLLDVLKYKVQGSEQAGSELQVSLPEVSEGFMAHNDLELAAREGILRVKVPGIDDRLGIHGAELTEFPPILPPQPKFENNKPPVASSSREDDTFKPMSGHTYFTIDEEFEAIPLMGFLANTCRPPLQKVVLFFDISDCQAPYRALMQHVSGWSEVFAAENMENKQSIEQAASKFADFQGRAILILPFKLNTPPSVLKNVLLGYCIYWGSTLRGFVPLVQAKKHRTQLKCQSTSIILTTTQAEKIAPLLAGSDLVLHPSSADLLRDNRSPWLAASRKVTRSTLRNHPELVREIYEAHLRSLGKTPGSLGVEEVTQRINKYTASVLLTGDPKDGSNKYITVAGRLKIPSQMVNKFNLQAAVDVGMLYIS